jgi:hypothetical protein
MANLPSDNAAMLATGVSASVAFGQFSQEAPVVTPIVGTAAPLIGVKAT